MLFPGKKRGRKGKVLPMYGLEESQSMSAQYATLDGPNLNVSAAMNSHTNMVETEESNERPLPMP